MTPEELERYHAEVAEAIEAVDALIEAGFRDPGVRPAEGGDDDVDN